MHFAAACVALPGASRLGAAKQPWPFLPIEDVGARRFHEQHPQWDGRGALVAVLDTGVDMGIPGLTQTSEGLVKVIDARDFSGQGKVELSPAKWVEGQSPRVLEVADGLWLSGFDQLPLAPADSGLVWTGVLSEAGMVNNEGTRDLDDNGNESDRWGFVVFAAKREAAVAKLGGGRGVQERRAWSERARQTEDRIARAPRVWVCALDRDRDGRLDGEALLRDYTVDYDTIDLRDPATKDSRRVLTLALDLRGDEQPQLSFHYDETGHGSHVAGIAAGWRVHGQEGMDGVAAGARVISCKVGDSRMAGGSSRTETMKKAFEYVARFLKDYDVPVVINMSYGIGSESEGDTAIDKFLDELLDKTSMLVIVTSAGNQGPGISSVGTPADADGVIACAALLTKEAGSALHGGGLVRDELYAFSSRGGDLAKPDVAAPGGASSTVPLFESRHDLYTGTSMASPHTAGSVACILGALRGQNKGYTFGTIKRALRATAKPLPGYSRLDVGAGVVDLPAAYETAAALADAGEAQRVTLYKVRTEAPLQRDGEGPAAYWRMGSYVPQPPRAQTFTITPRFADGCTKDERNRFYRAFTLTADSPWIRLDRGETYIAGEGPATVKLTYDPRALQKPGVYVGTVTGRVKGAARSGPAAQEFELQVTVVRPFEFTAAEGYERQWKAGTLTPGALERRFVRVPPGACAMEVELAVPEGKDGRVHAAIHDPQGRLIDFIGWASSTETRKVSRVFAGAELTPGVWEIVTVSGFSPAITSTYDLRARFEGFAVSPPAVERLSFAQPGEQPKTELELTALFDEPFRGTAAGEINQYRRARTVEVKGTDSWSYEFPVDDTIARVEFEIELPREVYDRMTDVPIVIRDAAGKFVVRDGLGYRKTTVALDAPVAGHYTLVVEGGFTHAKDKESWTFQLVERFVRKNSVALTGTVHDAAAFDLYPDAPAPLSVQAGAPPPVAPDGFVNGGELRLLDRDGSRVRLRVPVRLGAAP
jgi:tripeptidyl-peptidase-2